MFERDWTRACTKEKFTGMLSRENKACKSDPMEDKAMLKAVHDVLLQVIFLHDYIARLDQDLLLLCFE